MAKRIEIPIVISSPPVEDECTQQYVLEYKRSVDVGYQSLPATLANPIIVNNADAATLYNFRLTRFCCNGATKTTEFNYTTSA